MFSIILQKAFVIHLLFVILMFFENVFPFKFIITKSDKLYEKILPFHLKKFFLSPTGAPGTKSFLKTEKNHNSYII